jgi:hypothetical protein
VIDFLPEIGDQLLIVYVKDVIEPLLERRHFFEVESVVKDRSKSHDKYGKSIKCEKYPETNYCKLCIIRRSLERILNFV